MHPNGVPCSKRRGCVLLVILRAKPEESSKVSKKCFGCVILSETLVKSKDLVIL